MIEIGNELTDESSIPSGRLAIVLQQVCETTEWEYGEVWLPRLDSLTLQLSSAWYVSSQLNSSRQLAWQQFRYCSEKFTLRHGEGLPGRVWASQAPEWIADVSTESESYFLRNQIAKAFGVGAAFSLPISTQEIQAIIVFFKTERCDQDGQLMATTELLLTQLCSEEMQK